MKTKKISENRNLVALWLISLAFSGTHKALRFSSVTNSKAQLMTGQKRVTELKHLVKRYLCKTLPQNTAFRLKNQNILLNSLWSFFFVYPPYTFCLRQTCPQKVIFVPREGLLGREKEESCWKHFILLYVVKRLVSGNNTMFSTEKDFFSLSLF